MTRRWRSVGPRRSWRGAGWRRKRPPTSAGSIPKRLRACAPKPGPMPRADELHDALMWLGILHDRGAGMRMPAGLDWLATLHAQKRAAQFDGAGPATLWIAAERLPQFQALWPDARNSIRRSRAPRAKAERAWSREEALIELLRGRLEGLGRSRRARFRPLLGVESSDLECARGSRDRRFCHARPLYARRTPIDEWCERRLLARIHRYTVKRLRAEIEPVSARDFMRFLLDWQRVSRRDADGGARRGR